MIIIYFSSNARNLGLLTKKFWFTMSDDLGESKKKRMRGIKDESQFPNSMS